MQIKRIIDHLQTEVLDKILQQHFQQTKNIDTSLLDDKEKSAFAKQILSNNVYDKFKYNTNEDESEESEEEQDQTKTRNTEDRKSINTPQNRHKRAIPLIAPAIAALAGSSIGFALGAVSTSFSRTSSTDTSAINEMHIKVLKEHAIALNNLRINHIQTTNVINNVIDRLQSFEMTIMGSFKGVTSITMAMDLKALNEQLKTIAQLTLLKYTTALIAAADGQTSPYVLPQKDLDLLVQDA